MDGKPQKEGGTRAGEKKGISRKADEWIKERSERDIMRRRGRVRLYSVFLLCVCVCVMTYNIVDENVDCGLTIAEVSCTRGSLERYST